ncbi:MAG: flagellar export protein FliJ [Proteocatella sp.]
MKKFTFGLDTVLGYKNQILSSLKMEHGKILEKMNAQETVLEELKLKYVECNSEFSEKKTAGMTIIEARGFGIYLSQIEHQIKLESEKLVEIKKIEDKKRFEVVECRKESAAIEKLREKKMEQYDKEVKKRDELFIEEFVSNAMASVN